MKRKNILLLFFLVGATSMIIMSLDYFIIEDNGIIKGKVVKDSTWYRFAFFTHVSMGIIAITVGPFQFFEKLRQKSLKLHRIIGYIYCVAVFSASISGLVIAQFAMGGMITRIGFSTLSIIWLYSLFIAIQKIVDGKILEHQKWMSISYALTFAAITQRTLLLLAFIPGIPFMPIYQLSSWLPWIFNLAIAITTINLKNKRNALYSQKIEKHN